MQAAIAQSGLALSDIGYINAHATSTPPGDRAENAAVKELFGEHAQNLGFSSTKVTMNHRLILCSILQTGFSTVSFLVILKLDRVPSAICSEPLAQLKQSLRSKRSTMFVFLVNLHWCGL